MLGIDFGTDSILIGKSENWKYTYDHKSHILSHMLQVPLVSCLPSHSLNRYSLNADMKSGSVNPKQQIVIRGKTTDAPHPAFFSLGTAS